ncbi:hypothetical protein RCZ04_04360 [Capnocytophaga sp. HP1101]
MFKEKILQSLKTKYAALGLSAQVLEGVATNLSIFVTEENQLEPAIAGAEPMLKQFQSFADSRVNAFKTESEKYKKEAEDWKAKFEKGKEPADGAQPTQGGNNQPNSEINAVLEKLNALQDSFTEFKRGRTSETLKEQFVRAMKEKNIPESYYTPALAGRDFADNTAVEALTVEVSNGFEKQKQELASLGFSYSKAPDTPDNPLKEEEALAKQIEQGTKEIAEAQRVAANH